ncbi:CsbD family protein [Olivibacter sp. XZL3]|uniref:CsbD family protein n=1 Tax=Olivibacter sp. XZL3 TaxID=1735116 RepID=UPI001064BEF5|nr:CsbD family protein [Olivibacter sp. XZL3]
MSEWKLKKSWRHIKSKIKTKWGQLTDDDLRYEEGKEIELVRRLEQKTGKSREDIVDYLNHLSFTSDLKLRT